MWHPLGSLFKRPAVVGWSEIDIRYVVQDYIQQALRSPTVFCESVKDGRAFIRGATPLQVQQLHLLTFDIQQAVQQKTGYEITDLKVTR